jgi:hypothetical protein
LVGFPTQHSFRGAGKARLLRPRRPSFEEGFPVKFAIVTCILLLNVSAYSQIDTVAAVYRFVDSPKRIIRQPDGKFAVVVFPESALGTHCIVAYFGVMGSPKEDSWRINDRSWQSDVWSSYVTGMAWSPNGRLLYISTDGTYGDGGLFQLDLRQRSFVKVFPKEDQTRTASPGDGFRTEILGVRQSHHTLAFQVEPLSDKRGTRDTLTIGMP